MSCIDAYNRFISLLSAIPTSSGESVFDGTDAKMFSSAHNFRLTIRKASEVIDLNEPVAVKYALDALVDIQRNWQYPIAAIRKPLVQQFCSEFGNTIALLEQALVDAGYVEQLAQLKSDLARFGVVDSEKLDGLLGDILVSIEEWPTLLRRHIVRDGEPGELPSMNSDVLMFDTWGDLIDVAAWLKTPLAFMAMVSPKGADDNTAFAFVLSSGGRVELFTDYRKHDNPFYKPRDSSRYRSLQERGCKTYFPYGVKFALNDRGKVEARDLTDLAINTDVCRVATFATLPLECAAWAGLQIPKLLKVFGTPGEESIYSERPEPISFETVGELTKFDCETTHSTIYRQWLLDRYAHVITQDILSGGRIDVARMLDGVTDDRAARKLLMVLGEIRHEQEHMFWGEQLRRLVSSPENALACVSNDLPDAVTREAARNSYLGTREEVRSDSVYRIKERVRRVVNVAARKEVQETLPAMRADFEQRLLQPDVRERLLNKLALFDAVVPANDVPFLGARFCDNKARTDRNIAHATLIKQPFNWYIDDDARVWRRYYHATPAQSEKTFVGDSSGRICVDYGKDADVHFYLSVMDAHELRWLLNVSADEPLPWYFQHYEIENIYTGNSLLNRIDPLSQLDSPFALEGHSSRPLFNVGVSMCWSALNNRRVKAGKKPFGGCILPRHVTVMNTVLQGHGFYQNGVYYLGSKGSKHVQLPDAGPAGELIHRIRRFNVS